MPLFHCTHRELNEGDIIEPGNWGRIILETGETHPCWHREQTLESIRRSHYPQKPSRLESAFVCEHLNTIKCYKAKHCANGHIYEVELVNSESLQHKGDFNAVEPMPRHNANMYEIAHLYWQYRLKTNVQEWPNVECSEIVTSSPLKIIRRLSEN